MGKNRKNKGPNSIAAMSHTAPAAATPPAATTSPTTAPVIPAPSAKTPVPTPQWLSFVPIVISILAMVVSGLSATFAYRQMAINQQNQDRATGKIRANFAFVEVQGYDPDSVKEFIRKQVGTGHDVLRIDDVDELVRWAPFVRIKNTGDEVIDGIRLEVEFLQGRTYGVGVWQVAPYPIIHNDTSARDVSSFGKLLPNHTASCFVAPMLLEQMLQTRQLGPFPDADREDYFRIRVYCRLVGQSTYDAIEPQASVMLRFDWRQSGFEDETKCKLVTKQPPKVIVN